jgi:hypothetical protein
MALFAPRGVLRGFPAAAYSMYASPQTLVRPCATQKLLISELDNYIGPVTLSGWTRIILFFN